jgi:hypothetical protein
VPRPNSPCRAGYRAVVFYTGPDASTHTTHTVPRPVGALAAHAAAEMLGVQHRLAPGRTITACPGLQRQSWGLLGGCPASPVKVRWATPCHPPRHGSRPGVCFLSLISVPPLGMLLCINLIPPCRPVMGGRDRAEGGKPRSLGMAGMGIADIAAIEATPLSLCHASCATRRGRS